MCAGNITTPSGTNSRSIKSIWWTTYFRSIRISPHLRERADEVFRAAGKLRWVQALGTGVDNIADRAGLRSDVILTRMHAIHGPPMAEAALSAMLALSRG